MPRAAPTPSGLPLVGQIPGLLRDPVGTLAAAWRERGDVVQFEVAGRLGFHLLVHPSHVDHVLRANQRRYIKEPHHAERLREIAGAGLTMSEGVEWQHQRHLMQPAFGRQELARMVDRISEASRDAVERWRPWAASGRPLDLSHELLRLSLDAVARSLFGTRLGAQLDAVVRASAVALDHAYAGMRIPLPLPDWLPTPAQRRFQAARRMLTSLALRLIEERRRSPEADLLGTLVDAGDDEQARDQILSMILAGHDTTGGSLAWTLVALSRQPALAARLQAELRGALGGRPPSASDLPRLPLCDAVIRESLRLYPPAWVLSRRAVVDDEVGGFHIPAGARIFLSPLLTHRHPDFWAVPERFDPDRFLAQPGREPGVYFPFGLGPRMCIGAGLAIATAVVVLASTLSAYRVRVLGEPELGPRLTLHPTPPVRAVLTAV